VCIYFLLILVDYMQHNFMAIIFLFGMFLFFSECSFLNQMKLIWSLNQDAFYHLVPLIEYKSVEFGNMHCICTKFELKCSLNVSLLI